MQVNSWLANRLREETEASQPGSLGAGSRVWAIGAEAMPPNSNDIDLLQARPGSAGSTDEERNRNGNACPGREVGAGIPRQIGHWTENELNNRPDSGARPSPEASGLRQRRPGRAPVISNNRPHATQSQNLPSAPRPRVRAENEPSNVNRQSNGMAPPRQAPHPQRRLARAEEFMPINVLLAFPILVLSLLAIASLHAVYIMENGEGERFQCLPPLLRLPPATERPPALRNFVNGLVIRTNRVSDLLTSDGHFPGEDKSVVHSINYLSDLYGFWKSGPEMPYEYLGGIFAGNPVLRQHDLEGLVGLLNHDVMELMIVESRLSRAQVEGVKNLVFFYLNLLAS